MDVSDDEDEDSGEEEIVPRMGTIASLEQILRTLVVTIQDELPRLCEIMVWAINSKAVATKPSYETLPAK